MGGLSEDDRTEILNRRGLRRITEAS
jgi:hypothetical protein